MGFKVEQPTPRVLEAWYMDDLPGDQRLPHRLVPNQPVLGKTLEALGVANWVLDPDNFDNDEELQAIKRDRNCNNADFITASPEALGPDYETLILSFFDEHIHEDEEIRYCLEGSAYFDVRDTEDRWIRVALKKGDMISVPAGIYHRSTMDEGNYCKAYRLFQGEPLWTPFARPCEDHPARKAYVQKYLSDYTKKPATSITAEVSHPITV